MVELLKIRLRKQGYSSKDFNHALSPTNTRSNQSVRKLYIRAPFDNNLNLHKQARRIINSYKHTCQYTIIPTLGKNLKRLAFTKRAIHTKLQQVL